MNSRCARQHRLLHLQISRKTKSAQNMEVMRFHAENRGASPSGAWVKASREFAGPQYLDISGCGAVGLWVEGDASGALLNVQMESPREYLGALSEHYITLDFKGWRYFQLHFRERDTQFYADYRWPYYNTHSLYRNRLDTKHLSKVNIYLNNLPVGKGVDISLSSIRALPVKKEKIINPVVSVNGNVLQLPVSLESHEFLELESGGKCVHYSSTGVPLEDIALSDIPEMVAGNNKIGFAGVTSAGVPSRAEVTLISRGKPFGQMNENRLIDKSCLKRVYEMPSLIQGETIYEKDLIATGEKGSGVEIELCGPIVKPLLSINESASEFDVNIKNGERLICRDGSVWKVIDGKRNMVAAGELNNKLPLLKPGKNRISLQHTGNCSARLRIVKVSVK